MPNKEGRWVTIHGRAVFIGEGQSLEEALGSKGQVKKKASGAKGSKADGSKPASSKPKNANSQEAVKWDTDDKYYKFGSYRGKNISMNYNALANEPVYKVHNPVTKLPMRFSTEQDAKSYIDRVIEAGGADPDADKFDSDLQFALQGYVPGTFVKAKFKDGVAVATTKDGEERYYLLHSNQEDMSRFRTLEAAKSSLERDKKEPEYMQRYYHRKAQ